MVPSKSPPGVAGFRFPERKADPSLSPFHDLVFHRSLVCFLSDIIVADGIWPVDAEDSPQVAVTLFSVVLFALHVSYLCIGTKESELCLRFDLIHRSS